MGADMLTAVLATPANGPSPDFDAGREVLATITDASAFGFDDAETEIDILLPGLDPETVVVDDDGQPLLQYARLAGSVMVDNLEQWLGSHQISAIEVAGYRLRISGGLSWGDAPTEAAWAIWFAYKLPRAVLLAMGFVPDFTRPLARTNGLRQGLTDTDVVDAIALGLGTQSEWSGADTLEWIADVIGKVREHPGSVEPVRYLAGWREKSGFDPLKSNFLAQYVREDSEEEDSAE